MVKIILGCFVMALGLWGCDDDGGGRTVCFVPNDFPEFEECPAEAFMKRRVCPANGLEIEGFNQGQQPFPLLTLNFRNCEFPDCFTMDCEFEERAGGEVVIHNGVFFDLENYPGPGLVSVDGGDPVEYLLIPFFP